MHAVTAALKRVPAAYLAARSLRFALRGYQEREVALLPFIVDPSRLSLDVGANTGPYTHVLLKLGSPVISIEANPELAAKLTQLYGHRARIVCAAASSSVGTVRLRIPRASPGVSHGIATIEAQNTLNGAAVDEVEVPQITLDSMNLGPVGFIKVDVEGHEFDVLLGAKGILLRDHPAILVEAEERHRPGAVASIRMMLEPLGYQGFMLDGGRLSLISGFDVRRDQAVPADRLDDLNAGHYNGRYINNFLFLA